MSHPVVADMREAALKESGDVIGSGATIVAELGQLLAQHEQPPVHQQSLGPHQQGRLVDQQGINLQGQTVIFKSLGLAIQDAVAADLVLRANIE
jgi:ornithine cyclodeaminase/alanine dehydrogenase-like protein (mu-crystallin family)